MCGRARCTHFGSHREDWERVVHSLARINNGKDSTCIRSGAVCRSARVPYEADMVAELATIQQAAQDGDIIDKGVDEISEEIFDMTQDDDDVYGKQVSVAKLQLDVCAVMEMATNIGRRLTCW